MLLNFCLIGKIRHNFLVPRMIELACKTFMPIQTLVLQSDLGIQPTYPFWLFTVPLVGQVCWNCMKEGSKCVQNSLDAQQHGNIVYTSMTSVEEYQYWVHKIRLIFA